MITDKDTIAAIATAPGRSGIGIVRISGVRSVEIADRLFMGVSGCSLSGVPSHTVHYGRIVRSACGEAVDEVLVTVMRAPRTYTREDVVEINCHGGYAVLKSVLETCVEKGARIAEPGEFTKRAFLNGRIDLSQAEAVLDLINSSSELSRKLAVEQLEGGLSEKVEKFREGLLDVISSLELNIDFSEEDVDLGTSSKILYDLEKIVTGMKHLIDSSDKGRIMKEGASVVLCGRPNVGKSSLMNALLRHDRVIVTPVAGTTRDIVEESIDISGMLVRLSDTAGMIETTDRVEIEGIKRSKEKLAASDIVILVLDAGRPVEPRDIEIFETVKDKDLIVAANKCDLEKRMDLRAAAERFGRQPIEVSALKREGLEELEDVISEILLGGRGSAEEIPLLTNTRHKRLMAEAEKHLLRALGTARTSFNEELLALDLKQAMESLDAITGRMVADDVLDNIFSNFCIGK